MTDLIDRQAVLDCIDRTKDRVENSQQRLGIMAVGLNICGLPSVDPEQKTGTWRHYGHMLTCSECGTEYCDEIMEHCGDDVPHFCPNCGAEMIGKNNE